MAYSVDTTIQYRGYNTFKMIAPARVKSWMYGVEGLDSISHGLYVYCPTNQAAAVRAKTRWLNSDGITQSVVDHSFAIEAGLFNWIKIQAVPVPIGAVQAVTEIVNTSGATYWAGLIKTEAGDTATDFTENKAGQLTKITASGIYTGTIQAAQVVVANERLPDVLTSIQAGRITLSDETEGKIAGMTVDTTSLTFSGTGSYFRITSDGVSDFIRAGASSSSLSFRVDKNGKMFATGAEISGAIKASGDVDGALIEVEMSPANPVSIKRNGKPIMYMTGNAGISGPGILVTSRYDINEDGVVDELDLHLIYATVMGSYTPTTRERARMDLNGDGQIGTGDITQWYAGNPKRIGRDGWSINGRAIMRPASVNNKTVVQVSEDWGATWRTVAGA